MNHAQAQPDPHALMEAAHEGDPDAFMHLTRDFLTPVYRYFVMRTESVTRAERLSQELFSTMYAERISEKEEIPSFLRAARELVENPDSKTNTVIEIIPPRGNPSKTALHMAVASLPVEQQEVLILRFMNELSLKEVAHIVQKDELQVRVLQAKGLKALSAYLEKSK
jgi:DNA-directed RNA polymerase specialized sigma24 family protein